MMWLLVAVVCVLIYLVYTFVLETTNYWSKRRVPYSKPWPFLGNMAPFVFKRKSALALFKDLYNEFPDNRYNGIYTFTRPTLLIRDPDLIKQITVKDFEYFTDHCLFRILEEVDPVLSQNLVSLHGQKWRKMRSILSPFFTSSKMKLMFKLVIECAEDYVRNLEKNSSDIIVIEMKDLLLKFSNDAIATTAFGIKIDSINEESSEFFRMGSDLIYTEGLRALRIVTYVAFPALVKFFNMSIVPVRYINYFIDIVKKSIKVRETAGIARPDMIQIFLEAKKRSLSNNIDRTDNEDESEEVSTDVVLTDEDVMAAQAVTFLFASIENTSSTMGFMSYELALNPNVQKKLQTEIDTTLKRCDGKITYEALLGMKYFDTVVTETLRKWPPGGVFDRLCVKDYIITPQLPHEEPITIEKGMHIFIPLGAIHYDPKYFPNPQEFDPERFNEENKDNIIPFSYTPFGAGPRSCIGRRYALMEIKCIFFCLLAKFNIVPVEKTSIPIVETKLKLNIGSENGIWLGLQKRNLI